MGSIKQDYMDETYANKLIGFLSNEQFTPLAGWSVLSFGEPYSYTGFPKNEKLPPSQKL